MTRSTILTVPGPGVLDNDTIPQKLVASVEFLPPFPPGAGLTNLNDGGGFILNFTGNPFTGTVTFDYLFHTTIGDSNVATVTVQVTP